MINNGHSYKLNLTNDNTFSLIDYNELNCNGNSVGYYECEYCNNFILDIFPFNVTNKSEHNIIPKCVWNQLNANNEESDETPGWVWLILLFGLIILYYGLQFVCKYCHKYLGEYLFSLVFFSCLALFVGVVHGYHFYFINLLIFHWK